MDISKFTTIQFPSLGLEMNPPKGFPLFGFEIRFYGIIILPNGDCWLRSA